MLEKVGLLLRMMFGIIQLLLQKQVKQNIDYLATSNNIKRLQTAVRADFGIGIRFAKWLGFTNEGLMKSYGFDGSDHYRMARIY
jgi:RimJ/RimL family protein N-acetyltransferase